MKNLHIAVKKKMVQLNILPERTKMVTRPVLDPEGLVAMQVYSPSSDLRTDAILRTPSEVGTFYKNSSD